MSFNKLLLVAILLLPFFVLAQPEHLDKDIQHLMQKARIPGLSVAWIADGKIAYSGAFGVRSQDTGLPVDEQTVFAAASLSKPILAYIVLQLFEEGRFDLDKPLFDYLEYEDLAHDDRYRRITGRMALSHSSGLPNWRRGKLEFEYNPGERFRYSGEGFVYLQKVVEKITGKSLQVLAEERVFQPLDMNRSGFVWNELLESNYAVPHDAPGRTRTTRKPSDPNAAYSLQTTAIDYAKFILALIKGQGLKEATIDRMLDPQVKAIPFDEDPETEGKVFWGLGVGLQETSGGRQFWHWGDNGPFKAYFTASREKGSGIVYFANSINGLSITCDLVRQTVNTNQPFCQWASYPHYQQPAFQLFFETFARGYEKAVQPYLMSGGNYPDTALITEQDMNQLGYQLLGMKRYDDAKKVFRANIEAYPYSSNVYDSYAEACLLSGDFDNAVRYYRKAADMDPENKAARRIVDQLTQPMNGNTTFRLEGYADAWLVGLAGEFNNWNPRENLFRWQDGAWVCKIDLKPGTYKYKFVVDGVWILDPGNANSVYEDSNHNSVLEVEGSGGN